MEVCSLAVEELMRTDEPPSTVELEIRHQDFRGSREVTFCVCYKEVTWTQGHLPVNNRQAYENAYIEWGDMYTEFSDFLLDTVFDGSRKMDYAHVYVRFTEVE
jgi:hypothetical protein